MNLISLKGPYGLKFIKSIAICLIFISCEKSILIKPNTKNPRQIFEEAWSVIDKNYALFPIKSVDWPAERRQFDTVIQNDSGNEKLFEYLSDMLYSLEDGHVSLISATDTSTYDRFYNAYPTNFNFSIIQNNYLHNEYKQCGPVLYKIVNGLAYLYYGNFSDNINDNQLDTVFRELAGARGLIVDVRSNFGGDSRNAERLFQRFISERTLIKYEVSKSGPGHSEFSNPKPYFLEPRQPGFYQSIVVLTNRGCFSACNDFVLYMSELDNTKQVGDATGGGGGIPVRYILSNGWILQYSNTMTLSPGKQPIENGITPDFQLNISSIDELNGKDPILDKAIQLLQ